MRINRSTSTNRTYVQARNLPVPFLLSDKMQNGRLFCENKLAKFSFFCKCPFAFLLRSFGIRILNSFINASIQQGKCIKLRSYHSTYIDNKLNYSTSKCKIFTGYMPEILESSCLLRLFFTVVP